MSSPMKKRITSVIAGTAFAAAAFPAHALVTYLDSFTIKKNASIPTYFEDLFEDGSPPPAAPGEFSTYLFARGTFVEAGGKLKLDTATGAVTTNAAGVERLTTRATFSTSIVDTDTGNGPPGTQSGLKDKQVFSITGVFSLVDNTVPGDSYGVRFVDRDANGNVGIGHSGDDFIELRVVHLATGARQVQFVRQDFLDHANPMTLLDQPWTIDPSTFGINAQVKLMLSKESSNSNAVKASFGFVGANPKNFLFSQTADLFHGENWTRAEFFAAQALPVPEPEVYAMLLAGIGLIGWQLRRKAKRAAACRLF